MGGGPRNPRRPRNPRWWVGGFILVYPNLPQGSLLCCHSHPFQMLPLVHLAKPPPFRPAKISVHHPKQSMFIKSSTTQFCYQKMNAYMVLKLRSSSFNQLIGEAFWMPVPNECAVPHVAHLHPHHPRTLRSEGSIR